ncbi:recombinase RecT [Streptomyces spinosus]|uniref:recombinase RecT n=1 Tax=Streptomyces spinosus TaxID=2872623 RepID=UPI001CEC401D|nr:recombinase RecT [Streptomyces spinosus]
MSAEIVKHQAAAPAQRGGALSLSTMTPHDAWKFAEALAGSGMLPRQYQGNPASVLWALEYGRAIGLDVITTTQSVHVIQGRATASADLMASLTRRAGHRMRISGDDTRAEVTIFRADDPEFPFTAVWDIPKATRAKLTTKDTWKQFPGAMLRARAISECVRMACPEVLHGSIYTPEEIGANVDADGMPIDAEVTQLRRVPSDEPAQFEPHPEAQALARRAAAAEDRFVMGALIDEAKRTVPADARIVAPDTEQADTLREYLTRRWTALPKPDEKAGGQDDVTDAVVVAEGETEADAAERALRAAAANAGLDNLDEEFERSYGLPIAQAGAQQLREMTALLTGSAA